MVKEEKITNNLVRINDILGTEEECKNRHNIDCEDCFIYGSEWVFFRYSDPHTLYTYELKDGEYIKFRIPYTFFSKIKRFFRKITFRKKPPINWLTHFQK